MAAGQERSQVIQMRVAMVGCGGIADTHLQCIGLAGDQLVAAVDTNPDNAKAAAEKYGGAAMPSVDEALRSTSPDAAIIAAPPNVHREIVDALLTAGIPVLCEKPLAHTVADAEAMVETARSAGVPAFVAYCHRFNPAAQAAREMVREGKLGRVLYFRNGFTGYVTAFDDSWRLDPAVSGGGSMIDTGSHSLDLFQFIIGPVTDITASLYFRDAGRGDHAGSLMALSKDGIAGHIMFGWVNSKPECMFEVVGADMSVSYDYVTSGATIQVYRPDAEVENVPLEAGCEVRFLGQYKAFRDAVEGRPTMLATFADALSVSRLCERCYDQASASR